MIWAEALFAFFLAVAIALMLSAVFGPRFRGNSFWITLFVLFLLIWGIGAWATPVGPVAWGVTWVPFLVLAIVFALLFAALSPSSVHTNRPTYLPENDERTNRINETPTERSRDADVAFGVGVWLWIMIVLLIGILVASLLVAPPYEPVVGYRPPVVGAR